MDEVGIPCRICGSQKLERFLSLGPTPLANSFLSSQELDKPEETYPLDACLCPECKLVQLSYVVPPEKMFKNYLYFTANVRTLREHFTDLAREIAGMVKPGSLAVEFASNDGTLLKGFAGTGVKALGIDPAENIAKAANKDGVETICAYFTPQVAREVRDKRGTASAIIGTNVFAHIPDINSAVEAASELMADDGVLVLEFHYLRDLIEKFQFDSIYHEHVSCLSLIPLIRLFDRHGMVIWQAKRTPIHGGSLRVYVRKKSGGFKQGESTDALLKEELAVGLDKIETYHAYAKRVYALKFKFVSLISRLKLEGKSIASYGAAAKGNTLMNYFGLGREAIDFLADKSPAKQGRFSPGRRVPVVPPSMIMEKMPDYVIIFAWNVAPEIMSDLDAYRKAGGKFIIPVPEPTIV